MMTTDLFWEYIGHELSRQVTDAEKEEWSFIAESWVSHYNDNEEQKRQLEQKTQGFYTHAKEVAISLKQLAAQRKEEAEGRGGGLTHG